MQSQPSLYKDSLDYTQDGDHLYFKDPTLTKEEGGRLIKEVASLWFVVNDGVQYLRYQPSEMRRCLDQYNTL